MRKRVLSGMQPSGRMHLGNLLGALENWKRLQDDYECYFFVADWHAISTHYADTSQIKGFTHEMLVDWLAAGLDPERSTIFIQSRVPEHAILHILLSMITPVSWLERNPTYKDQQKEMADRDLATYGFLGYPVLQAADILIYKPEFVPVGIDQLPHLELTREICRRFNGLYPPVFPEPKALMTEIPKVPGVDGRKMSKSYGNAVYLSDTREEVEKKILTMVTDPARKRRNDPGNPEVCPVFSLHRIYTPAERLPEFDQGCRTAGIGCIDCKRGLLQGMQARLEPIRQRREEFVRKPEWIEKIAAEGSARAREVAAGTLKEAEEAMSLR